MLPARPGFSRPSTRSHARQRCARWLTRAPARRASPPELLFRRYASASGQDGRVALGLQDLDHRVAVVALDLDDAILDRAADAAALLEPARELLELRVVDGHT